MSANIMRFKRIPIGTRFSCWGQSFRKISGTKVIRVGPNGCGRTHEKITFPYKNTYCEI